jgi:hypothetical protein
MVVIPSSLLAKNVTWHQEFSTMFTRTDIIPVQPVLPPSTAITAGMGSADYSTEKESASGDFRYTNGCGLRKI